MITEVSFALLICHLIAPSTADDNFFNDEYVQTDDNLSNVDFNQLNLLRNYVYGTGENRRDADEFENWQGRWMPERADEPGPPPKIFPQIGETPMQGLSDIPHGVAMGKPSSGCDDAKTNLTMDWSGSPGDYICYKKKIVPNKETIPHAYCERIPKNYVAMHKCMHEKIEYDDNIPLFGSHRPLWPIYGEYKFVPKQRWLHSLEHGGIVALYHPCANPLEVKRLKNLVTGCLRRHVITPYNLLSEDRPLALVAWGCRLTMSYVNPHLVTAFIRKHALQGPEEINRDGDYDEGLLNRAEIVSDIDDSRLCPDFRI